MRLLTKLRLMWRLGWRELRTGWGVVATIILVVAIPIFLINAAFIPHMTTRGDWSIARNFAMPGTQGVAQIISDTPITQTPYLRVGEKNPPQLSAGGESQAASDLQKEAKALQTLAGGDEIGWRARGQINFEVPADSTAAFVSEAVFDDYSKWSKLSDEEILAQKLDVLDDNQGIKLVAGKLPREPKQLVLSEPQAKALGLKVGDKVGIYLFTNSLYKFSIFAKDQPDNVILDKQSYEVSGIVTSHNRLVFVNSQGLPNLTKVFEGFLSGQASTLNDPPVTARMVKGMVVSSQFLISGDKPLTFDKVQAANQSGILVGSKAAIHDSVLAATQTPEAPGWGFDFEPTKTLEAAISVLAVFAVLLVYTLVLLLFIPLSSLFVRTRHTQGEALYRLGLSKKQWANLNVISLLLLSLLGWVIGTGLALLYGVYRAWSVSMPLTLLDLDAGIFVVEIGGVIVGAGLAGLMASFHLDSALEKTGNIEIFTTPQLFRMGVGLTVAGILAIVLSGADSEITTTLFPLYALISFVGMGMLLTLTMYAFNILFEGIVDLRVGDIRDDCLDIASWSKRRRKGLVSFRIAWREFIQNPQKFGPWVGAVAVMVALAIAITPLLGRFFTNDGYSNGAGFAKPGAVLLDPMVPTSNDQKVTARLDELQAEAGKYLSLGKSVTFDGVWTRGFNQSNLDEVADPGRWKVPESEVRAKLPPDVYSLDLGKMEASEDGGDAMPVREGQYEVYAGAIAPDGKYRGCPDVNPHTNVLRSYYVPTATSQWDKSGDSESSQACADLAERLEDTPDSWTPFAFSNVIVNDGELLQFMNYDDDQISRAAQVLKAGGAVVNDPALIVDGKTTVEVALGDASAARGLPDPAFPAKEGKSNSLILQEKTVPAVYLPLPFSQLDHVMIGTALAEELGLRAHPVGRIVETTGFNSWFAAHKLEKESQLVFGIHRIRINQIAVNPLLALSIFGSTTVVILLITMSLLFILNRFRLQKTLRTLHILGTTPRQRSRVGGWFAALVTGLGFVGGIIFGAIVLGISFLGAYLFTSPGSVGSEYFSFRSVLPSFATLGLSLVVTFVLSVIMGCFVFRGRSLSKSCSPHFDRYHGLK